MTSRQHEPLSETLHSAAKATVLSAVWDHAPISRRALGRLTGLAPSSVTRLTRRLQDDGLIEELRPAPSTGGRPPMLLTLSDGAGVVIGVDLSGIAIRGAVVTPTGRQIADLTLPFVGGGEEQLQGQIEELIEVLRSSQAARDRRLLAIGVSVPGTVDQATGTVVDVTHLRLRDYPLGALLRRRFGLPVLVEHDTAAAAYAEKHDGAGRGLHHLIFITIASGIGAGVVVNDRIYRGEGGAAGELGHIVVEVGGPACPCGKQGCLEAVASAPALLEAAQALLDCGASPVLAQGVASGAVGLTIDALLRAAEEGDAPSSALVEREAEYLAHAIGTITSLLDIRTVIIGGERALLQDALLDRVRRALPRFQLYSNPVRIVRAQLGQDAGLRGASALAFRTVFQLHGVNGEETPESAPRG